MSAEGLEAARSKMVEAGVQPQAIEVFTHYYHQLEEGVTGLIPEDSIEPLTDPPMLSAVEVSPEQAAEALGRTAIIKLNGGLGTSMGMEKAKSLLPVRGDQTFLDLIVEQVRAARETYGVRLPLLFMDSFRTRDDTLAALAAYDDLPVEGLDLDFEQNLEPKLLTTDLTPVEWPADPSLEWCPPGHGDLYTTLEGSGVLDRLLEQGYAYASVSNSDNLGAAPDGTIAGWFAASGAPYAAEVCRRTPADRKGGHLAIRKSDGRLILRDTAQTAPDEMHYFTDEHRHPFFHCNNLWFDLAAVSKVLKERKAVLGLPLIKNVKNVDPADSSSPEVVQIESAMGAAIEVFAGAHGDRRGPGALPAGEDDERPDAAPLRRLRRHARGPAGPGGRPGPAGRPRPALLQDDHEVRPAVPRRRPLAQGRRTASRSRGTGPSRATSPSRERPGSRTRASPGTVARGTVLEG